ncbi:MAG: hypothetical protein JWQ49_1931 [Edaphobacter sp.]|nr:hypothetical protein [Edaphobacter sp.]
MEDSEMERSICLCMAWVCWLDRADFGCVGNISRSNVYFLIRVDHQVRICITGFLSMVTSHGGKMLGDRRFSLNASLFAIAREERAPSPISRPFSAPPGLPLQAGANTVIPITQGDANRLLAQARAIYKGGWKSGNKIYISEPGAPPQQKHLIRNANAQSAKDHIPELRTQAFEPPSAYGQMIVEDDQHAGNCGEMSAVVAYYCQFLPSWQQGACRVYYCKVLHPGDHAFIVLSGNGMPPPYHRLAQTSLLIGANFWVVDCWLNIACPFGQYLNRAIDKLREWGLQRKGIKSGHTLYDLRDGKYQENMRRSGLRYSLATP